MMKRLSRRLAAEETGAVAIITALTLTALVLASALVLDIGALRQDQVQSKAAADMAAVAAAVAYDPEAIGSARGACEDAVAFVETNLTEFSNPTGAPGCEVFPANQACSPSTPPRTAVYTAGPYTVGITSPVPYGDVDGFDLMEGMVHAEAHDGLYCDRVAVRITRDRDFLLAPVAGFAGGDTTASSVARFRPGGDEEIYASLVILRAQGCGVLKNSGNDLGRLIVGSATAVIDGETVQLPGTITVDTMPSGSCNANNWQNRVIAVQDNGQALIRSDGRIFSFALQENAPTPRVYWDNMVRTDPATTDGLYPRPSAGPSITREPVDHRFNCLSSYPTDRAWSPAWTGSVGLPISDCTPDDPPPPYLKNLWDALAPLNPSSAAASGWSVFPTDVPGASCTSASGTYGPSSTDPALQNDRWYIDCPSPNGQAFAPAGISFAGVRYIVSRNQIRLGGGEGNFLTIDGHGADGAVLFVQNGQLYRTGQARLYLLDTFVYLNDASAGFIEFGGNNPNNASLNHPGCTVTGDPYGVCWHAPAIELDGCETYTGGLPPAACFTPLALWSNGANAHDLGGQATFDISGSFFTPNATPFSLSGQSQQNFTKAQFFTAALELSGQAPVLMAPNPDTNIPIPLPGTALIR
jgi:hypothetical protein